MGYLYLARLIFCIATLVSAIYSNPAVSTPKNGPTVSLSTGVIEGVRLQAEFDGENRFWQEYRGIRYAEKPTRFNIPFNAKNHAGTYDASKYKSQCVQRRTVGYPDPYYVGDEDCLFMNVLVPETSTSNRLPVLFWVHGGSYKHGNGSGDVWSETNMQYDGRYLALQEDIIVVNFNYRVNSFGLLSWQGDKSVSDWTVNINGKQVKLPYQNFYSNLALYDAKLAFEFIYRNIGAFGGDPNRITIGGASAGAGLTSVLTSIQSVADKIVGIIQESGDAFGPTTGFMEHPDENLDIIAGYNHCDMTSEKSKLDCLKDLSQYDLLKFSHKRTYAWVIDGDIIDKPYYDFLLNSKKVPLLGGINDGDALTFAPDWIKTANEGTWELYNEYTEELLLEHGLSQVTADMLQYAYTNWTNEHRNEDWWIRTGASYMSTDWRYGSGIEYKMRRRQESNNNAVNYFYNFNHTNGYYKDYDLNQAVHIEERLYIFGAPFAMPSKFSDDERELSKTMMSIWGKFISEQSADWEPYRYGNKPGASGYIDIKGLHASSIEPHNPGSRIWLDGILKENMRQNCLSHVQCPYPSQTAYVKAVP